LCAAPALAAAPLYKMTLLASGTSDTRYLINTRINNDGLVAGAQFDPVSNAVRSYLWKDGVYTMLDTPINHVSAISANGRIAGEVIDYSSESYYAQPAVYANGSTTAVPPPILPAEQQNYLSGINSAGKVAGTQYVNNEGYAYTSVNGVTTLLGALGGVHSYVGGMNEAGVVVGAAETASGDWHMFRHDGGGMVDLGALSDGRYIAARDINDDGVVVGGDLAGPDSNGYSRALIYQDGELLPLGTFAPGENSFAVGINNLGQVIGNGSYSFLVSDGVTYKLSDLLTANNGFRIDAVHDINDSGQITGTACAVGAGCFGMLLSPVPEPGTALMLLAGLGLLFRLRRPAQDV
jgi:probable HAF family extracellular repeat protein